MSKIFLFVIFLVLSSNLLANNIKDSNCVEIVNENKIKNNYEGDILNGKWNNVSKMCSIIPKLERKYSYLITNPLTINNTYLPTIKIHPQNPLISKSLVFRDPNKQTLSPPAF